MAYIKVYYPTVFYATYIDNVLGDASKISECIKEAGKQNISILSNSMISSEQRRFQDFMSSQKSNFNKPFSQNTIRQYTTALTSNEVQNILSMFAGNPNIFEIDNMQIIDEVIRYIGKRFGEKRVAHINTFGTYKARLAIRDVARMINISDNKLKEVLKYIPQFSNALLKDIISSSSQLMRMMETTAKAAVFQNA